MEKKLIVLALIALLGGLGGGYGLGYVTYQPQIWTLQSNMKDISDEFESVNSSVITLNSTIEMMENRSFHQAFSIEGSSSVNTSTFLIRGEWIRIRWFMSGQIYSWISISLYYSNGTECANRGSSGVFSSFACDFQIDLPNIEYYLEIATYGVSSYWVYVWDYY